MAEGGQHKPSIVGVPTEIKPQEMRVGFTPYGVRVLTQKGIKVIVQRGAGLRNRFSDRDYIEAGAKIVSSAEEVHRTVNFIKKIKEPLPEESPFIRRDHIVFTYLHLSADEQLTEFLIESGATGIAYETVVKDDWIPLLEPMSKIAGILVAYQGAIYFKKILLIDPTYGQFDSRYKNRIL